MRLLFAFAAVLLSLLISMVIQTHSLASEKSRAADAASQRFAQLSDQFVKDSLALQPVTASYAGYHKHVEPKTGRTIELDAQLDDMSLAAMTRLRDFYASWRERFRKETPVSSL